MPNKVKHAWPALPHQIVDYGKFAWPAGSVRVATYEPVFETRLISINPNLRPPPSATATWYAVAEQAAWDFNKFVEAISRKLYDYSSAVGTPGEGPALQAYIEYLNDPVAHDATGPHRPELRECIVAPVLDKLGRILGVRVECEIKVGEGSPAGYSSSSSSVAVYP